MRIVLASALLMLGLGLAFAAQPDDFETRVSGYLVAGGQDPAALKAARRYTLEIDRFGLMRIARWDAAAIGLPEPAPAELPDLVTAQGLVAGQEAAQAAAAEAAAVLAAEERQKAKPGKLKDCENAVVAYWKDAGVVTAEAATVTPAELDKMYAGWEAAGDEKADREFLRYLRLVRRVLLNGGSESDIVYHP